MITERTHDRIYLNEKRLNKEYFKMVYNAIREEYEGGFSLLDIGCATGDFLYFAKKEFKEIDLYGLDVMPELLEKIDFCNGLYIANIADKSSLPDRKFKCITMLGVLSIFDDFQTVLRNVFSLLDDGGSLYLFGIFNPEDIDVLIKSKAANVPFGIDTHWESGWNYFSKSSVEDFVKSQGFICEFTPFNINMEIKKRDDDPLRSWTEPINGGFVVVNGLQIIHHFYLCKIRKSCKE